MAPTYSHRIRYHETDAQGFLFNSRYLELVDVAFTELIRELGWSYHELIALGADPSVVRAEVDYLRPLRMDDVVELYVHCLHVGRSSFRLRTEFRRGNEDVAAAELAYVNVDPQAATSTPLPEVVADRFRKLLA